jgi:hypothetical protein
LTQHIGDVEIGGLGDGHGAGIGFDNRVIAGLGNDRAGAAVAEIESATVTAAIVSAIGTESTSSNAKAAIGAGSEIVLGSGVGITA